MRLPGAAISKTGRPGCFLARRERWLVGTGYPTWEGSSRFAGHVFDADGLPGSFSMQHTLRWVEEVKIHAWGQTTTQLRSAIMTTPEKALPPAPGDRGGEPGSYWMYRQDWAGGPGPYNAMDGALMDEFYERGSLQSYNAPCYLR